MFKWKRCLYTSKRESRSSKTPPFIPTARKPAPYYILNELHYLIRKKECILYSCIIFFNYTGKEDFFMSSNEILSKEEEVLLKTVRSVTGDAGRPVKLTDNFFDTGGHSLNAISVVTKLRDQGLNLGILFMFVLYWTYYYNLTLYYTLKPGIF